MSRTVLVEAVRTPLGKRGGALSQVHAVDLLATALEALLARSGIDPGIVEDHVAGCVSQIGEQAANIGRQAALAAGMPEHVPGVTVDRQCGSSQQAVNFAAHAIDAGMHDVVIASGVESMSRVPLGSTLETAFGTPYDSAALQQRYPKGFVHQGISAEIIAERWGLTRGELDQLGLRSHERAARAQAEGRFAREIVPVDTPQACVGADEGIRPGAALDAMAKLRPAFKEDGLVTAGNSSQISDGAAAVLLMSEERARALGLRPRARFRAFALAGVDPIAMLTGPAPATSRVLDAAGLGLADIGVVEINEAFASVVLAWQRELGIADEWFEEHVNPSGGAIALGHPVGASGARLLVTMLHEMERRGARYGLQTMCEGGGTANATILELAGA